MQTRSDRITAAVSQLIASLAPPDDAPGRPGCLDREAGHGTDATGPAKVAVDEAVTEDLLESHHSFCSCRPDPGQPSRMRRRKHCRKQQGRRQQRRHRWKSLWARVNPIGRHLHFAAVGECNGRRNGAIHGYGNEREFHRCYLEREQCPRRQRLSRDDQRQWGLRSPGKRSNPSYRYGISRVRCRRNEGRECDGVDPSATATRERFSQSSLRRDASRHWNASILGSGEQL